MVCTPDGRFLQYCASSSQQLESTNDEATRASAVDLRETLNFNEAQIKFCPTSIRHLDSRKNNRGIVDGDGVAWSLDFQCISHDYKFEPTCELIGSQRKRCIDRNYWKIDIDLHCFVCSLITRYEHKRCHDLNKDRWTYGECTDEP